MEYLDIKPVLSIAGSDSSGGAGIQADIKTILANGCYGMTAITALTAQNTVGVRGISEVEPEFLRSQLEAVFDDILPEAVKVGMVAAVPLIDVIADVLSAYSAKNIVVDPVMVSTSGSRLLKTDAQERLCSRLFPLAALVTPNIPEAECISGISISGSEDMERAGSMIADKYHTAVLVKGGHNGSADDLLVCGAEKLWFYGERIDNENTHGTGCTLSSAIACNLAKGCSVADSVRYAKDYISGALRHGISLGQGSGPLNHGWRL